MRKVDGARRGVLLLGVAICFLACGQIAKADFTFGTATKVPNVNSSSNESPPDISADGLELYFSSNRPHGDDMCYSDIWVARRSSKDDPWGIPVNLGPIVNSPTYDSMGSISADGLELYFSDGAPFWYTVCVPRPGGYGGGDLWVSTRETAQGDWSTPVNLGPKVNSPSWEDSPSISPDGLSLFFISDRPGGYGRSDLYMTTRQTKDDPWGPPMNLGLPVNGSRWQTLAEISPDGLSLFVTGGTTQLDILVSRRATTADPWGPLVNLGPSVNTPKDEYGPTFSADGSTLYFTRGELAHPQPNPNLATFDIWQAEVIPFVDFDGDGKVDGKDVLFMAQHWGEKQPLCDIGPTAFGDGVVDVQDLIVLAKYIGKEVDDPTLMAHWAFDETEGAAPRDSVSGSEAIVNGGANWQPAGGKVKGALQFDGTDDYVTTPFVLSPSAGPLSIFAWVKGGAPGQVVLSQANGVNWLMASTPDGALTTELRAASRRNPLASAVVITDGAWHRVGLVWDGSHRVLYIDDVEATRDAQTAPPVSVGGLYIGAGSTLAPGSFWSGLIDDIRIYSRVVKP